MGLDCPRLIPDEPFSTAINGVLRRRNAAAAVRTQSGD